jgi:hypothetical protein
MSPATARQMLSECEFSISNPGFSNPGFADEQNAQNGREVSPLQKYIGIGAGLRTPPRDKPGLPQK